MPAVANIVLNDAQGTPVAHTFVPLGPDQKEIWWFEDQSGTSAIGNNRLSVSLKRPSVATAGQASTKRFNRVELGIWTPKLETLGTNDAGLTPSPTVAYVPKCMVAYSIEERATLQDRKDLRKYMSQLNDNALITQVIEQLLGFY